MIKENKTQKTDFTVFTSCVGPQVYTLAIANLWRYKMFFVFKISIHA